MCGIYGAFSLAGNRLSRPEVVEAIGRSLHHRGPDCHHVIASAGAIVGAERLRVIDLDHRADQPFESGGLWLACNGEIYNHRELRARYPEYPWQSRSDIETILPLYMDRGAGGIRDLTGMFAIALFDPARKNVVLARDRAGEKPLFYSRADDEVWFASEIQALLEHPAIDRTIDERAAAEFLRYGFILEPRTIYRSILRVASGTARVFSPEGEIELRYWDPPSFKPEPVDEDVAVRELRRLLEQSVRNQMIADVPVGVFVSGGLDSAAILALASGTGSSETPQSFSIRFVAESYDESSNAADVARLFRSRHHIVTADEPALQGALDEVLTRVGEPIADPAVLPTVLLARRARENVVVVLSGEGADELFGGYPTYIGHSLAPAYAALPALVRRMIAAGIEALPSSTQRVPVEFLLKRFVSGAGKPWIERHRAWFGSGLPPEAFEVEPVPAEVFPPDGLSALRGAMLYDYLTYLRDNLLVKIDRATMLSSIESRAPYLDREIAEFAFRLPEHLKVSGLGTKRILKRAAEAWLPSRVIHRRKRGLSVPIADWINGSLRRDVDRLLDAKRLDAEGIVRGDVIAKLLDEHHRGVINHARALWPLIVFEMWKERRG